jgi:hypothetical protein
VNPPASVPVPTALILRWHSSTLTHPFRSWVASMIGAGAMLPSKGIAAGSIRRISPTSIRAATFRSIRMRQGWAFQLCHFRSTPIGEATITIDPGTGSATSGYTERFIISDLRARHPARALRRVKRCVWKDPTEGRSLSTRYASAMPSHLTRTLNGTTERPVMLTLGHPPRGRKSTRRSRLSTPR